MKDILWCFKPLLKKSAEWIIQRLITLIQWFITFNSIGRKGHWTKKWTNHSSEPIQKTQVTEMNQNLHHYWALSMYGLASIYIRVHLCLCLCRWEWLTSLWRTHIFTGGPLWSETLATLSRERNSASAVKQTQGSVCGRCVLTWWSVCGGIRPEELLLK